MCCFSRPVRFVGKTRIFARDAADGRQWLAYAMDVELAEDLAMVLPLPVPPGSPEDAVRFVDLEGYPTFFADLEAAFPPVLVMQASRLGFGAPPAARAPLRVHDVGMFEASFVPTRADFARLDARFRLPDAVFDALPRYADWGFAVFRLKPRARGERQSIHPMAFSFPRREPNSLFFPTVHVHDGGVPTEAAFDHRLFAQSDGVLGATLPWTASERALGHHVDARRAHGLVDPSLVGRSEALFGALPNDDVWLRPPAVRLDDLTGRGELYAYRANATRAYTFTGGPAHEVAWQATARSGLQALCARLRHGLPRLFEAQRARFRLAPLTPDLAPHFMNGPQLWRGTSYMDGHPAVPGLPGKAVFHPFTMNVEPQDVTIGFASIPDADMVREIDLALRRVLDGG